MEGWTDKEATDSRPMIMTTSEKADVREISDIFHLGSLRCSRHLRYIDM